MPSQAQQENVYVVDTKKHRAEQTKKDKDKDKKDKNAENTSSSTKSDDKPATPEKDTSKAGSGQFDKETAQALISQLTNPALTSDA